jgi:polyhydroxybutyrate depolymerase
MSIRIRLLAAILAVALSFSSHGQSAGERNARPSLQHFEFTVDSIQREALVYVPTGAKTAATPLVFVFHGHGGSAEQAARSFAMDRHWPEAISVYMQGLKTPGKLTDPKGDRAGWQTVSGDEGDRDLKFFDAVLARLKKDYQVDTNRIYATGHSNGGAFTYLLWLKRGDIFAAVASSAAVAGYVNQLNPKPVMHFAGENDPLVKFSWQKLMMESLRKLNGCSATGEPWDEHCTIYSSQKGTPVVTFIHPGGHEFNPDAPALMVKFFKQHPATKAK